MVGGGVGGISAGFEASARIGLVFEGLARGLVKPEEGGDRGGGP